MNTLHCNAYITRGLKPSSNSHIVHVQDRNVRGKTVEISSFFELLQNRSTQKCYTLSVDKEHFVVESQPNCRFFWPFLLFYCNLEATEIRSTNFCIHVLVDEESDVVEFHPMNICWTFILRSTVFVLYCFRCVQLGRCNGLSPNILLFLYLSVLRATNCLLYRHSWLVALSDKWAQLVKPSRTVSVYSVEWLNTTCCSLYVITYKICWTLLHDQLYCLLNRRHTQSR